MGTRWPEICWANYKGEINILLKWHLVGLLIHIDIYFNRQCLKQGVIPKNAQMKIPYPSPASKGTQKKHRSYVFFFKKKVMLMYIINFIINSSTSWCLISSSWHLFALEKGARPLFLTNNRRIAFRNTGLFEMIVGVLTTCHTQHTWDRSICVFYLVAQHSMLLLHTLQMLYMCTLCDSTNINTTMELVPNPLWHVSGESFNVVSDSYLQFRDTHAPCLLKLCIPPSNGIVRWWLFPEFGAELPLDICTPTIILNNPVYWAKLLSCFVRVREYIYCP